MSVSEWEFFAQRATSISKLAETKSSEEAQRALTALANNNETMANIAVGVTLNLWSKEEGVKMVECANNQLRQRLTEIFRTGEEE